MAWCHHLPNWSHNNSHSIITCWFNPWSNAHAIITPTMAHSLMLMQLSPTILDHDQFSCNFQLFPTKFCNAHLMQHYNYHLIRWILTENWMRIEWELTFHFCLGCRFGILSHLTGHYPARDGSATQSSWCYIRKYVPVNFRRISNENVKYKLVKSPCLLSVS